MNLRSNKMTLRLCFYDPIGEMEWKQDSSPAGGRFKGNADTDSILNHFVPMMLNVVGNLSVTKEKELGDLTDSATGSFDGCIGS